jgi:hypothetical protein
MSDIVERLQRASVYEYGEATYSSLGDEAADEIERWYPIQDAPKDREVILGWIVNPPTVEQEVRSRWLNNKWEGDWTPTHWRPCP